MITPAEPAAAIRVPEGEYLRLLGYPLRHSPNGRAHELMRWARSWFAANGRPWSDCREVPVRFERDVLHLDDREYPSPQLRDHLRAAGATRAVLVAVSAGPEAEAEARRLWELGRPDEYFFLETYASAVVEQLIAAAHGQLCDAAAHENLMAVPHLSPGYTGWTVADQGLLFRSITADATRTLPGPLDVLASGMLRPKKSLLAVVGLAPRTEVALRAAHALPCERCSYSPCNYRRSAYRHAPVRIDGAPAPQTPPGDAPSRGYSVNPRALSKWADERTRLEPRPDGSVVATFRFDGTTCSNMGRPLAFDFSVHLGPDPGRRLILQADCRPVEGDTGHRHMCAYFADAPALMRAIGSEKPILGRPLDAVLDWKRPAAPAGCLCDRASREHKWGLALEVIHFALARHDQAATAFAVSTSSTHIS